MTELMVLRAFQREIAKQCRYALFSLQLLDGANAEMAKARNESPQAASSQLWYALQGFLVSTANVSKFMWPGTSQVARKKRQGLRQSLSVAENSVLRLSPEFRNHFEHLDQRVEEWAEESSAHNMVDEFCGPLDAIVGIEPGDFLRSYDPTTHTLGFRGESFEMLPVIDAINALLPIAEREGAKPHWDDSVTSSNPGGGSPEGGG